MSQESITPAYGRSLSHDFAVINSRVPQFNLHLRDTVFGLLDKSDNLPELKETIRGGEFDLLAKPNLDMQITRLFTTDPYFKDLSDKHHMYKNPSIPYTVPAGPPTLEATVGYDTTATVKRLYALTSSQSTTVVLALLDTEPASPPGITLLDGDLITYSWQTHSSHVRKVEILDMPGLERPQEIVYGSESTTQSYRRAIDALGFLGSKHGQKNTASDDSTNLKVLKKPDENYPGMYL